MGALSTARLFRPTPAHFPHFHSVVAMMVTDTQNLVAHHNYDIECYTRWFLDNCHILIRGHDHEAQPMYMSFEFTRYDDISPQITRFRILINHLMFHCRKLPSVS